MSIPKVNTTVAAVRESWAGIEARRAARQTPGGGNAKPLSQRQRAGRYEAQNGAGLRFTPRQLTRFMRKGNRSKAGAVSE